MATKTTSCGVIVTDGKRLLLGHASRSPLWDIPKGGIEPGETPAQAARRELREETGLDVRVVELIEVFERIFHDEAASASATPRYHFVILDYLCEVISGEPRASSDVTELAWAREEELGQYRLTPTATRVLRQAFQMVRTRPR